MTENWITILQKELAAVYGPAEGLRISMTIVPGIAADFKKMLDAAQAEQEISETYRLEGGRADVTLRGKKTAIGIRREKVITGLSVSGKNLPLPEVSILK